MSQERVTRRGLIPRVAVTAGTAAALTQSTALAQAPNQRQSTAGPCGLWRGHVMLYQFFLPAVQRGVPRAQRFVLSIRTIDGTELVRKQFDLTPGTGVEFRLEHREDGTLVFDGEELEPGISKLVVIAIIAILIGLLLPAVQKVRASATSFVPNQPAFTQNVNYLLPFIEQDN